jgi:exopolysaccharide biosynthesis polyprenyl glycosylphosphotransferase
MRLFISGRRNRTRMNFVDQPSDEFAENKSYRGVTLQLSKNEPLKRRSYMTHLFKILFIVGELVLTNLVIIASFFIIYNKNTTSSFDLSFSNYLSTVPLLMIFGLVYIDYLDMTHFYRKTNSDVISASFRFSFLMILTASTIAFFFKWFAFPRYVLALSAVLMVCVTTLWSSCCLWISKRVYRRGQLMIIASDEADADHLYSKVFNQLRELHIDYHGYTCSKDMKEIMRLVDRCDEVLVSPAVSEADKASLLLYCANTDKTIYIVPQFADLILTKYRVVQFSDMPTFMIDRLSLTYQQRLLKRLFDIIFSSIALIISSPIQLAIGVAVRLTSPGPALYSQERITLSGRIYKVYKFRTMVDQAEVKFGAYQSSQDDPRVTRLGRFLRDHRLDELPQLLNILRGDMSVVGPRSDRPTTVGAFEGNIPGYNQRLKVKAGLTGLAQIYGKYDTDPEDKLRFDMMYIKNYSFLLDLKIIMQTVRVMLPLNIYQEHLAPKNFEMK